MAVNPLDPYNMVASSKRFTNPSTYNFSLAAYATFDGGLSWVDSSVVGPLALLPGWAGTSDPAVAWGNMGDAYLVGLPFGPGMSMPILGICVYKSADGGRSWGTPTLIHASSGDDKQWAAGDINPASPHYGNVYAAWDDGSSLRFARTTDHGASWIGTGADPAGSMLAGDSFAPEVNVAPDGTVYIVWLPGSAIKFVKSIDGGNFFSAPQVAATGITNLGSALPITDGWHHFPGATFRVLTLPTGCASTGNNVVFAWADYREGVSRIYYRRSSNGGTSWLGADSGQPLLTGGVASPASRHDFHPQLISTPTGEIGCAFYEFGPSLIDVILAVSTDHGGTFTNRATVTDSAWDPAVDAPFSHGDPNVTFIGEYFGFDASRLGFFPLWTDTRTGVQEIFTSRLALRPADVYIRDSSTDVGGVPSPGNHWEAPDLIVRAGSPDGDTTFVNQDLIRDGVTDHYVYGRVTNTGPNDARNVKLAVTVGNYPSLIGLPGSEFRYPQDWYQRDWSTLALQNAHLYLGESPPVNIPVGATRILGPVLWAAAQIPPPSTWHPCLLAEARCDNDDSAGGPNGCPISADPDPCAYGSYFWGDNNICQRNLSYQPMAPSAYVELPFIVGSVWSNAKYLEVIVDKGRELAFTPMTLRVDEAQLLGEPIKPSPPGELVLVDGGRIQLRAGATEIGEIIAAPGTIWRTSPPWESPSWPETCYGGEKVGREWKLNQPRSAIGFRIAAGEVRRMSLGFRIPEKIGTDTVVRIFQRNNKQLITGSVQLVLQHKTKKK